MDYFDVYVLTSLSFDAKGNVISRNVLVTFDVFEAEAHKGSGVENDFEKFEVPAEWRVDAEAVAVDLHNARVPRNGQGYAGRGIAVSNLTKSRFVAGVQCLKRLYWQVHEPELAAEPDAATEAIIQQGREVGLLARLMFPGGVEVHGSGGLDQAIRATRSLVANREVPAIFEGVFEHGGVLVRVDILQRRRDVRWRLIEVKSTADLKEHHLDDVAIQARVVFRSGSGRGC